MVIGNNTTRNTYAGANALFDEIETFNYPLTSNQIASDFQAATAADTNLNKIPDIIEDLAMTAPQPFFGAPVQVAGTIEAEQFDRGGQSNAYYALGTTVNTNYRISRMSINACNDIPNGATSGSAGYCLSATNAGEWVDYSINVLVSNQYTIDTRVAGIGAGGTFAFTFSTNGVPYLTQTNPPIATNNWSDVTLVTASNLMRGTNVMRLTFLSHGTNSGGGDSGGIGQFNYISIYPYWTPPMAGPQTNNNLSASLVANSNDWGHAYSNAVAIENAINGFTNGGTVQIPSGTFYVAEPSPNESNSDWKVDVAISNLNSNIRITGTGASPTNTTLIAYDRATIIFALGETVSCTNFMLDNLTLAGQPHMVVTNGSPNYPTSYESGSYQKDNMGGVPGVLCAFYGGDNILVTNCVFSNADRILDMSGVFNCVILGCTQIASNLYSDTLTTTNPTNANTVPGSFIGNDVGIFARGAYNLIVADNYFNGNTAITNAWVLSNRVAPDGFLWGQNAGNVFVAGNVMVNHDYEAVQLNAGPNAVTGNTFNNAIIYEYTCALNNHESSGYNGADGGTNGNYLSTFVGNWVCGEFDAVVSGVDSGTYSGILPNRLNFSGNFLSYPSANTFAYPSIRGVPGVGAYLETCSAANICGNALASGGYGVFYTDGCTNALVLNNDFSGAFFGGIGGGVENSNPTMATPLVNSNKLAAGISFHVQLPPQLSSSAGWFLYGNQFLNTASNAVLLFVDPVSSGVHIVNY